MKTVFDDNCILHVIGIIILILDLSGLTVFTINPFTKPQENEAPRTNGLYSVVRHPLYFCDSFWPLGLSLIFRSVPGTVLVIVWLIVAYLFAIFEEEKLIEAYGEEYVKYKRKVKWRIVPYLL